MTQCRFGIEVLKWIRCWAFLCLIFTPLSWALGQALNPEQVEFFESKVRPILVENCYQCHSVDAEDVEAGLLLDSKWGWETGGDTGPAIVPGQVDESLLIEAVRYTEDVVSGMPPRSKLPDKQIAILEQWVAMGAPDPRPKAEPKGTGQSSFDLQQRFEQHWSWRPITAPQPPAVQNENWPLSEIDRFVLAKIEDAGLMPAEDAEKQTWLRRVYFDLIGLPPTIPQIERFLKDDSDDAYRRVVDELMKSTHFGEKWARHWMDLVRYAETYGHEFDYALNYAHEYRDYLIRAFNADVPYDQFIREHIAGDLLDTPRRHPELDFNESIIGTGFWYLHEATHAPTDVLGNEADIVDNQIDVFGKAFLGLTVACARCHDHKFDAISTADYYALSAYLQSSCRQEVSLDVLSRAEQTAKRIDDLTDRAEQMLRQVDWETEVRLRPGAYFEAAATLLQRVTANEPKRRVNPKAVSDDAVAAVAAEKELEPELLRRWVDQWTTFMPRFSQTADALAVPTIDVRSDSPAEWQVFADFDGDQLPEGWSTSGLAFKHVGNDLTVTASGQLAAAGTVSSRVLGDQQSGILRSPTFEITTDRIHIWMRSTADVTVRVVIDNYYMAHFNALLFKKTFLNGEATDTEGQWAWKSLEADLRKYVGHRAYLEFIDHGGAAIEIDQVLFSDGPPPTHELAVTKPRQADSEKRQTSSGKRHAAFANQKWREAIDLLRSGKPSPLMTAMLDANVLTLEQLQPKLSDLLRQSREAAEEVPPPRMVVAMAQGTPEDAHIYIRGGHNNLGPTVPPRFLEALGGEIGDRRVLASKVASADNPLTARVITNRIWHHLLGRGIVPTVDDFGPQGQPASHPELLDWLASDFIDHQWSLKHVISQIVLSRTYRQSSVANAALEESMIARIDPTNQFLHRMPVRRLPAEAIRDAILLVSGTLHEEPFGPSVVTHRTPFMTGRGARSSGPLDGDGRRSIYLSVYRNFLNPFMLTFDTPSPFGPQGRRSNSNVPAQALTLMNDPLVTQQAGIWAEQLVKLDLTRAQRIERMVLQTHGVEANADQIERMSRFLDQQSQIYGELDQRAWADLGHALFNMKAFFFLR